MKKKRVIAVTIMAVLFLLLSGLLAGWCFISIKTPEPLRSELDYFDEGSVILMLFLSVGALIGSLVALFNFSDYETEVTDKDLENEIDKKARELLDDALNNLPKPPEL